MARMVHTRLLSHVPLKSVQPSLFRTHGRSRTCHKRTSQENIYSICVQFLTCSCVACPAFGARISITRVTKLLQGPTEVLSSRNVLNGFRTLCTSKDLTIKKCVPCDLKELRPMTIEAANGLIKKVPKWELINEEGVLRLRRSWKVKTFAKGLDFFKAIAAVAEAEGHHPDLHLVGWNNVKIEIWTHAVGGLTENDFILATKIDMLDLSPLLSRNWKPVQ